AQGVVDEREGIDGARKEGDVGGHWCTPVVVPRRNVCRIGSAANACAHAGRRARRCRPCRPGATGKRGARLREEPRLASPLPCFLHTGGGRAVPYGEESSAHKKPRPSMVGVGPHKLPPLSLDRTSQRHVGQVSWLAAFPYSLHLPEAQDLSGLC